MAVSPNRGGYFPNDTPFLGFDMFPLLYPFRVMLPFQVKGELESKGDEVGGSKGNKNTVTNLGEEVLTLFCISLHSI